MAASPMTVPWRMTETTIELAVRRPRLGPTLVISANIRLESRPWPATAVEQRPRHAECAPDARWSERKGGGAYTPPVSLSTRGEGVSIHFPGALAESGSVAARRKRPGPRRADSPEREGGARLLFYH